MNDKPSSASPSDASAAPAAPAAGPLELISTCQVQIAGGGAATWTAFRSVGAKPSAWPAFYVCTLPANRADGTPGAYSLRAIAAQALRFEIELTALDRDVTYLVMKPGSEAVRVPVERGVLFLVPARWGDGVVTEVQVTFEGGCCTLKAIPRPAAPGKGRESGTPVLGDDDDDISPPPLP